MNCCCQESHVRFPVKIPRFAPDRSSGRWRLVISSGDPDQQSALLVSSSPHCRPTRATASIVSAVLYLCHRRAPHPILSAALFTAHLPVPACLRRSAWAAALPSSMQAAPLSVLARPWAFLLPAQQRGAVLPAVDAAFDDNRCADAQPRHAWVTRVRPGTQIHVAEHLTIGGEGRRCGEKQ